MRLEQSLVVYRPSEPALRRDESLTLEFLSASPLYGISGPLGGGSGPLWGAGLHRDFGGNSWGRSFDADLYIKKLPPLGDLHVHCTGDGVVTGANLNGLPLTNYEAAMLDILEGISKKKEGFGNW